MAGKTTIEKKFENITKKVDFLLELCKELETVNEKLVIENEKHKKTIKGLIDERNDFVKDLQAKTLENERLTKESQAWVQEQVDELLEKLDAFSKTIGEK